MSVSSLAATPFLWTPCSTLLHGHACMQPADDRPSKHGCGSLHVGKPPLQLPAALLMHAYVERLHSSVPRASHQTGRVTLAVQVLHVRTSLHALPRALRPHRAGRAGVQSASLRVCTSAKTHSAVPFGGGCGHECVLRSMLMRELTFRTAIASSPSSFATRTSVVVDDLRACRPPKCCCDPRRLQLVEPLEITLSW